jgi:hypothetical protein
MELEDSRKRIFVLFFFFAWWQTGKRQVRAYGSKQILKWGLEGVGSRAHGWDAHHRTWNVCFCFDVFVLMFLFAF